jgi:hypothetical protein
MKLKTLIIITMILTTMSVSAGDFNSRIAKLARRDADAYLKANDITVHSYQIDTVKRGIVDGSRLASRHWLRGDDAKEFQVVFVIEVFDVYRG